MAYMKRLETLPAEIVLMISNNLPFKTYIQLSQTCRTIHRNLTSTNCINYLNQRFKFGQDTGSLLLFTYYNILYIPRDMSKLVLHHFISTSKHDDIQFLIKGWSLIHAIHCLDPGRFMTLLLSDECDIKEEEENKALPWLEAKKKLLAHHQRTFAIEIIDSIITSQVDQKDKVVKSKTYQAVFKNLVQSGDLRTVENCSRSLGPPFVDIITINDSDYNNRFPLIDQQASLSVLGGGKRKGFASGSTDSPSIPIETGTANQICRDNLYLNYSAHEMRTLTEKLLEKYNVKVNNVSTKYTSYSRNNNSHFNHTSFDFGSYHHRHYHHHHHLNQQHRHHYYRYNARNVFGSPSSTRLRMATRIEDNHNEIVFHTP